MSRLKIQSLPGMSASVPTNDSQTAEETLVTEDSSSSSTIRSQEARQAVQVAKSRLGDIQITAQFNALEGPQPSAQFNPKEYGIDKLTQLQESSSSSDQTNKADTSSKKNLGIFYNGHAGLGDNG